VRGRRLFIAAALIVIVVIVGLRLAVTPTFVGGYRIIDDSNLALQVIGAQPTWRAVTVLKETPSDVTVGVSEISLQLGPGFGDERTAYVVVMLSDPLGARRVLDASTGAEIPRLAP
jgi:hypothetical protein